MELIEMLQKQLGVGKEQAKGGAGLLFRLAKQKLGEPEFSRLAHFVPNMNELLAAAPAPSEPASTFTGLGSAIGSNLPGLGAVTELADGFSKLGLNSSAPSRFLPLVLSYLRSRGGEETKALVERALGQGASPEASTAGKG
jgi:hypothetical protein